MGMLACDGPNEEVYCKACYGKRWGPKDFGYGHSPTLVSVDGAQTDAPLAEKLGLKAAEGEGCSRCGYCVYAAEQMISKNRIWHRRCFNCAYCHRSLDSTNLNDAPDNEIYCAGCYRKTFGPHGSATEWELELSAPSKTREEECTINTYIILKSTKKKKSIEKQAETPNQTIYEHL